MSHALLHDREVMDAEGVLKDQTTKEVEAESIAYIVCNHFGLDTSEYSFTYIASWCESRDMKALKASMDTIRKHRQRSLRISRHRCTSWKWKDQSGIPSIRKI